MPTTITVGLVTSLTGAASAAFLGTDAGSCVGRRINQQNAEGGVNGRQIKLVVEDNQSSPQGEATAAESLVQQKHAFADISWDPLSSGGEVLPAERDPGRGRRPGWHRVGHAAQHQHVLVHPDRSALSGHDRDWHDLQADRGHLTPACFAT